jgi:hypothetical protein
VQTCYGRAFDVRTATTQSSPATRLTDHHDSGRTKPVDRFCHSPDTVCVGCRHQQAFDAGITHIAVQPPDGFP